MWGAASASSLAAHIEFRLRAAGYRPVADVETLVHRLIAVGLGIPAEVTAGAESAGDGVRGRLLQDKHRISEPVPFVGCVPRNEITTCTPPAHASLQADSLLPIVSLTLFITHK